MHRSRWGEVTVYLWVVFGLIGAGCEGTSVDGSVDAGAAPVRAMFAVHIDPDGPMRGVANATPANWLSLSEFVDAADDYGFKLTLLMGADWPELIGDAPGGVERVADWINAGHQLGFHHHSCGHVHPDGFRDVSGMDRCGGEPDRGSVRAAFEQVTGLAEAAIAAGADASRAIVDTAAQGPNDRNTYRSVEWQPEARYATGPQNDNTDGHEDHRFITVPRCTDVYGNNYTGREVTYEVAELGHAQLDVGGFVDTQSDNHLTALEEEIALLQGGHGEGGAVLGIVLHGREYTDQARSTGRDPYTTDRAYLDALLQTLAERRVEVVTAREILQPANPCSP